MDRLMSWHFDVQQGMYFDKHVKLNGFDMFLSDIIQDSYWNYAIIEHESEMTQSLCQIEQLFHDVNRQPCMYIECHEDQLKTADHFISNGYTLLSEESFMVYSGYQGMKNNTVQLNVKRVVDDATTTDFIDVFTNAYGGNKTPEQPYGELGVSYMDALTRSFSDTQKFHHIVCYEEAIPVSIASLCYANGKGGIYNVGTLPDKRGKGFGTAATNACIDEWKKLGGDKLFLQTETGSKVEKWYSNLGFKLVFIGRIYIKD